MIVGGGHSTLCTNTVLHVVPANLSEDISSINYIAFIAGCDMYYVCGVYMYTQIGKQYWFIPSYTYICG